jgi:hypothetical protein
MGWSKFIATTAPIRIQCALVICLVLSGVAAAQDPNDITLSLVSTNGSAGDTVEVSLTMSIEGSGPESMIVFLAYDPDALSPKDDEYEIILRNAVSGEPLLDDDGNTMVVRSAVLPSDSLGDVDKTVDSEVFSDEGVVGVSIAGLNTNVVPAGLLFTVAFTVSPDLGNGSTTEVIGLSDDNAVVVPDGSGGATPAATSASRSEDGGMSAVAVSYGFQDTELSVGCEPPETPAGVSATQDRSDSVLVNWSAVGTTGAEYRVFRSTTNLSNTALPLGDGWQSNTSFMDVTALVPETSTGDGCTMPSQATEVRYFYWVKARTVDGCQGALSNDSAEGFRVQAKKVVTAGAMPLAGTPLLYGAALVLLLLRARGDSRRA